MWWRSTNFDIGKCTAILRAVIGPLERVAPVWLLDVFEGMNLLGKSSKHNRDHRGDTGGRSDVVEVDEL